MIEPIERMRKLVNDNLVMGLRFQMNRELNELEHEIEQELNRRVEHTCRNIAEYTGEFKCSECGAIWRIEDEACNPTLVVDGVSKYPCYCMNCGCKVVSE